MTIKQVEEILGIPKATIRFYEKEGLICPSRKENGYRDYNEDDVLLLKRIIIFRKLGLSVELISDLQSGAITLQEALDKNISNLQKQAEELNGSLRLCKELQTFKIQIENFNDLEWWNRINMEEKSGAHFADLARDYLEFQGKMLEEHFAGRKVGEESPVNWKKAISGAVFTLAFVIFSQILLGGDLNESIRIVFTALLLVTLIEIPIFFMRRKNNNSDVKYRNLLLILGIIVIVMVIVWTVLCLINAKFHFMW